MAVPNMNAPAKVEGLNAKAAVGTSVSAVVSNATGSSATYRVVSIYAANVDTATAADISIDVYDGTTAYSIVKTVSVPADATLSVIDRPVYLAEGDSLRASASAAGDIEVVVSYEKIT